MKLDSRATIASEPDSCWVAPRSDKGRYFSTALPVTPTNEKPREKVAMKETESQRPSHPVAVDPAVPSRTPEAPTHPALDCWDINRKLKKLEQSYRRDQEKRPAEIESSPIGNPRSAAISYISEC